MAASKYSITLNLYQYQVRYLVGMRPMEKLMLAKVIIMIIVNLNLFLDLIFLHLKVH